MTIIELIKKIITNVLITLYQPFVFAVIVAVLFTFLYMYANEYGWDILVRGWVDSFKKNKKFRLVFFLVFYTVMILFQTLLNRSMWANPVSNVIGVWGLYNEKGELTTDTIENLVLFVPFTVLLLCSFREKTVGSKVKLSKVLWQSVKIIFIFSLIIEFLQLFLRLGTFQLSDLFFNTLGGLIGGLIYWITYRVSHRNEKKDLSDD